MGSAREPECYLLLARNLQLLAKADYERLAGDATGIKPTLTSLIQKLTARLQLFNIPTTVLSGLMRSRMEAACR